MSEDRQYLDQLNYAVSLLLGIAVCCPYIDDIIKKYAKTHLKKLGEFTK